MVLRIAFEPMVAGDSPERGTPAAIPSGRPGGSPPTGSDDTADSLRHLGEELVTARQGLGLSRRDLADRLHLGESQLAALEEGNSDLLPEPVYIRAWLRTLAHALGLDADRLLARLPRDLQRNGRVRPAPAPATSDPVAVPRARPQRPAIRRGAALAAVALLAIAIGGTLTLLSGRRPDRQPAEAGREPVSAAEERPPVAAAGTGPEEQAGAPAGAPAAAAEILIRAKDGEPSWISLRDGQGTLVFEGLLEGSRTIAAGDGIELLAGRPDLVSVGPSEEELRPLGSISEVRWVALDSLVAGSSAADGAGGR
jgi:transcriptional regulator with XRE-family HTH domain